jgi:predicted nuclease of predicted toxin-antitoxin system
MWLLDANVDVHLVPILKQQGIACDTVAHRGWKALSNGDLVAVAYAEGFRCLLTRDQLFGESASRALKSFAEFGVVVITLSQQRWPEYRTSFLEAWGASPIQPVPGHLVYWPSPPPTI